MELERLAEEQTETAMRKHQLEVRRRQEEEARQQEEKKIVQQELERKKRREEEEEKTRQEELEKERQTRLEEEQEARRVAEEDEARQEEERERLRVEEEETEEVRRINKRIREIEESIAMLDWQLERQKIEKMKVKTQKVIKRISEVVADDIDEGEALKKETVRLFLYNKSMWKKYVKIELENGGEV